MKGRDAINAEKSGIWQCCGEYHSRGVSVCPRCGRSRPDGGAARTPDAKPERGKCDALDAKGEIAKALSGAAGRFRVTIERHSPRTLDGDNFWGGCKQLRDAVAELLGKSGDSETDGLEFRYVQVKSKVRKTVVKIQQIKENVQNEDRI